MSPEIVRELRKFVAPEFIFGIGCRFQAGKYIKNLGGRRILLVTDPGIIEAGWEKDVHESLLLEGLEVIVFSALTPNPKDHEVMAGAKVYKENSCDSIVAVGGGSPVDCAKGIGIVVANDGHILEYEGVDTVAMSIPPLVCIPTTAGAAADVSQFAIVTDVARKTKIAIITKAIVPDVALIDPEVTTTMNPYLTACTGVDALTHAIEAFVSNANSPITDLHALKAIELVKGNLYNAYNNPENLEARQNMCLGCLEAGLAFSNASLGAVHAMAHSLGGFLDLPHGECNSVLLSHVVNFNFPSSEERFQKVADIMELDHRGMNSKEIKNLVAKGIYEFRSGVGIKRNLGEMGVRNVDINDLAEKAVIDPCLVTNPREAEKRDLEVIYEEAL